MQHSHHDRTGQEPRRRTSPLAWLLIQPIRGYQRFITRYTPATCRYYPTCSAFAVGALRTHGAAKGTILTVWRILRCNPWSAGGIDHVPERGHWRGRREARSDVTGEQSGPPISGPTELYLSQPHLPLSGSSAA